MKEDNTLLVHVCCAPCSGYVLEELSLRNYNIEGYFYNPNIHPAGEYTRRLEELLWFSGVKNLSLTVREESPEIWYQAVKGYEKEEERGKRCEICYHLRLERTAIEAIERGFKAFTTTLTVSPHKDASLINKIGREIQAEYEVQFLEEDFKKDNGFKKSIEI